MKKFLFVVLLIILAGVILYFLGNKNPKMPVEKEQSQAQQQVRVQDKKIERERFKAIEDSLAIARDSLKKMNEKIETEFQAQKIKKAQAKIKTISSGGKILIFVSKKTIKMLDSLRKSIRNSEEVNFDSTKTEKNIKTKADSSVSSVSKINKEKFYEVASKIMKGAETAGKATAEVAKKAKENLDKKIEDEKK